MSEPHAQRSALRHPMTALGVGASILWVLAWLSYTWAYWEDDAFIHLEYARSVWQGQGFVFNGVLSNGDTSPAWVLLLAAAWGSGLPWLLAGKALTLIALLFTLIVLWRFAQRVQADLGLGDQALPTWMLALFVSSPYFCFWAFSGMEATWAAGWLMLQSMLLTPLRARPATLLAAAACVGLGPVIRPEFLLMFPVAAPFLLRQWWQVGRAMSAPARAGLFLLAAVLLAWPLLTWVAYATQAFGHVMPNTNAAKRAAPGVWVPLRLVQVFGLGFPGVLMGLGLLAVAAVLPAMRQRTAAGAPDAARRLHRRTLAGLPQSAVPLAAWVAAVVVFYVLNHTHVQTRYALVMAPGLMCLLWALSARHLRPGLHLSLSVLTLSLCVAGSLWMARPHLRNKMEVIESSNAMVAHIQAHVPEGQGIAVYAIGQYGFMLQGHRVIDIGGITRPQASRYQFEVDPAGLLAWAKAEGARFYIAGGAPEPDARLLLTVPGRSLGWHLRPQAYELDESQRLWALRSSE